MKPFLRIAPSERGSRRVKGRIFEVHLLGLLVADQLWDAGSPGRDVHRPALLTYMGSEQMMRSFTANLRSGRKAEVHGGGASYKEKIEIPKRSHRFVQRRLGDGLVVATVYRPELVELEQPFLGEDIRFIFAPSSAWVGERAAEVDVPAENPREVVCASLFAAFLDRRTDLPILADPRFHLQIYRAALAEEWFGEVPEENYRSFFCRPSEFRGLDRLAAVILSHDELSSFLAREMETWRRSAAARRVVVRPRWTITAADAPPVQLDLFSLAASSPDTASSSAAAAGA